jgi:hypothetical protein
MDMRFGTWNIRSMYRAGSLKTAVEKYELHLVGVQEVRWDRGDTEPAGKYTFCYGKGKCCIWGFVGPKIGPLKIFIKYLQKLKKKSQI